MGIPHLAIKVGSQNLHMKIMEYFKLIEIFFLFILIQGSFQEKTDERNGKVFSLFSIVTFPNAGCASQSIIGSKARNGTCFTATECSDKGGTVSGNCAAGFGVCCLFITSTSGSTSSQNCSYIQNPNYPNAYGSTTAISFTVAKCSSDVCGIRLDFESFILASGTSFHDAATPLDTFQITTTPKGLTIPAITGLNAGYHVYVELGKTADATALLAFTFGSQTISRYWDIKVTQLECTNRSKPASGCLQYFTGTTGRIETFNFQNSAAPHHLHNQNYNICIRQANGFSCIQYTACGDTHSFALSEQASAKSTLGTACTSDWLNIAGSGPCGLLGPTVDQFCGSVLNTAVEQAAAALSVDAAICDCSTPFIVSVHTNAAGAEAIGATAQRGVCLEYKQY